MIGLAKFVEMFFRELGVSIKLDLSQSCAIRRYFDLSCKSIQQRLRLSFNPDVQFIFSGGYAVYMEDSLGIGDSVVGSRKSQYNRAHLWMYVAKDIRHTFAREGYGPSRARFV